MRCAQIQKIGLAESRTGPVSSDGEDLLRMRVPNETIGWARSAVIETNQIRPLLTAIFIETGGMVFAEPMQGSNYEN